MVAEHTTILSRSVLDGDDDDDVFFLCQTSYTVFFPLPIPINFLCSTLQFCDEVL
uniref:Uncharacterized protein n=1 Tax=Anguilla anguilla TaxID=7936 RepID=A0A0E9WP82_ANGAN